jgi:hypothetical protein
MDTPTQTLGTDTHMDTDKKTETDIMDKETGMAMDKRIRHEH